MSSRSNAIGADSMAISVPVPIAMPTSACASAGASFTPSPTMATTLPLACSLLIASILSDGSVCAVNVAMPARSAMAAVVFCMSPESNCTATPNFLSLSTASTALALMLSPSTKCCATASPSMPTKTMVLPASASRSVSSRIVSSIANPAERMNPSLPRTTREPSTVPSMPMPSIIRTSVASKNLRLRDRAASTNASAIG